MGIGVETFLQPALQPVFDLIFSKGVKLFVRLSGGELEDTLEKWESELMLINDLLDDAVAKQFQSKSVQRWLMELQDLAFDMEDILGDFAIQAQEHEFNTNTADQQDDEDGVGHGVMNAVSNVVASISDSMSTLYNTISPSIQSKIEAINTRLHRIQSRTQFLHLSMANTTQQHQTLHTEALRSQRESSSLVSESKVFGRDDMKQEIITRLLKEDDDPSNESYVVIPIVGSGGIGKTTLAQCVYNDEQLKDHFNLKAWVCVSDVFDVKRITTTIITANGARVECSTLDEAQTELKQILMGRKFLIVLDDIWNEKYHDWFRLQTPFKHGAKGSRLIMTTRIEDIAKMMINGPMQDTIINLKGLSKADCWNLFKQHANRNDSDLAEMQDDIIKKCKGLPLAAKALGGLFRKTVDKRRRRMILESNIWIEDDEESDGVLPVLRLSYDYLPSKLKRVFAYLSLFPKDYEFKKMEVILLWMAQGFLPNDEQMEMEDTGHNYFNDLESRSLVEQCSNPSLFIMHDLIHDLALWAASGICYGRGTKNMTRVDRERIRHVFLTNYATSLLNQLKASHLRTVYNDDRTITNLEFIQSLRYVRSLKLESDYIRVVPECIGVLKHLRFLSLKNWSITELPESINCLWNLQTLDLKGCDNLKKVPYIGSLKKLRHLKIGGFVEEIPQGFEKLTNLKSLDYFRLAHGYGSRIKELKNINHLQGQLTILGLQNVSKVEDAKEAQLHQKSGLDELSLQWETCEEQVDYNIIRDVVEQLRSATSIKECTLRGYMGLILPAWLGDPSFINIVTLKLDSCSKCEELPPLGQLPCLEILAIARMKGIKRVGVEFYGCSNPFPALEYLEFKDLKCWEKWEHIAVDSNRAFPCLQSIEIVDCNSLKGDLPPFPPSLKTLEIQRCRELSVSVSLPNLPLLEELRVFECKSVSLTTEDVKQGISEEGNTPTELVHLHLRSLSIKNCPISLPEHLLLPALKYHEIHFCITMESLASEMQKYTSLQRLYISKCPKLQCFLEGGGGLPANLKDIIFQELGLHRLYSVEELRLELGDVETEEDLNLSLPSSSLREVHISEIYNLKNLRVVDGTNLKFLVIEKCIKLESLVVGNCTSLQSLHINNCRKPQCFLRPGLPENLKTLEITGKVQINEGMQEWGLHRLHSLEVLKLQDVDTEEDLDLSLSSSSLREVHISEIYNLKNLRVVDGTNLKFLVIEKCRKLESLVVGNSTSLSTLKLEFCPKLQLQCLPPLSPTFISELALNNLGSSTDAIEQIPGPNLELPSSLRELIIGGFQNLKTITCSTLPYLNRLFILCCPKFESFGDTALPSHLENVCIFQCELIKPHLQRNPYHGVIRMGLDSDRYSLC